MPATDLKIGTFVLIPNLTYKLRDSTKKEIVQHRNILLPYYPKKYALRELTQLYSFIGLKVIPNNTQIEQGTNVNDDNQHKQTQKQNKIHKDTKLPNPDKPEKERKKEK